jgi:hypothetical protein
MIRSLTISLLLAIILCSVSEASDSTEPHHARELQAPGLALLFHLSDKVYAGSAPEGDAGFESLRKLGIKTIITVDGTKPDIERAHKFGFRYVHLPHGYDGISTNTELRLIKAAETVPGPIYVHCHHGKHRGPTAAAVICMATEGWSTADGLAWLKEAGTSTNYGGLFETVEKFNPFGPETLSQVSTNFPEVTEPGRLIDTMVDVDSRWDELTAFRKNGFKPSPGHPDFQPSDEAALLFENFREAQRLPEAKERGNDFLQRLHDAETKAQTVHDLLTASAKTSESISAADQEKLARAFDSMGSACAACHKNFRNPSRY